MDIKAIASGSSGNAYVVSDGTTALLLECGVPIKKIQEALDYKLASTVSACFITHEHLDHCRSVEDIIKAGIDCYASRGTWIARGRTCDHQVRPMYAYADGAEYNTVAIGSLRVRAFAVQHDAAEPLGFLIDSEKTGERLLYFTDTFYLKYRFDGVTHIMAECNYCADTLQKSIDSGATPAAMVPRLLHSHMSMEQLIEMLKNNDLSRLRAVYLIHLSTERSDAERMKAEVQKLTGAEVYVC
jgi:phosphoribosyl 1,2-cyclic phosphodiesterase